MNPTPNPILQSNKDFDEFIHRLVNVKLRGIMTPELKALLSNNEFDDILNYLIQPRDSILWDELRGLNPNGARRIFKNGTSRNQVLPRTLQVLRDCNGEYMLIVETKNKLAGGLKPPQEKRHVAIGRNKRGKSAWRIDTLVQEEEFFNLACEGATYEAILRFYNEAALSQCFQSKYVNAHLLGEQYKKRNGNFAVSMFSRKAVCTLFEFDLSKLSYEQKVSLIHDLLYGIKAIHDSGNVHQDIKDENLLIYNFSGQFRLRISDLGDCRPHGFPSGPSATYGFESPTIRSIYRDSSSRLHKYYYASGAGFVSLSSLIETYQPKTVMVDKANDIWAAGIVIYIILNDRRYPTLQNYQTLQESLLKRMLEPVPERGINIDEAIKLFHLTIAVRNRHAEKSHSEQEEPLSTMLSTLSLNRKEEADETNQTGKPLLVQFNYSQSHNNREFVSKESDFPPLVHTRKNKNGSGN